MRLKLSTLIFLFAGLSLFGQRDGGENDQSDKIYHENECLTPSISYDKWIEGLDLENAVFRKNSGMTQLPIRAHIVTQNDGTGGLPLADLNEALANLNNKYFEASIEWYLADVNYIASTAYYDFNASTDENPMCNTYVIDDAVNVFFVNSINGGGVCGYAYYPFNSDQSLRILMDNDCTSTYVNGTFVHEFGHHLSLPHTHNNTSNGPSDSDAEHVPRTGPQSNCTTDGDYICDTAADPTGTTSSCNYTGGGSDIYGNPYNPDVDNIMSYYPDWCGGIFTPGQYSAIGVGLASRLGHSAYEIDGAPYATVNDPSGLSITNNVLSLTLNWNDNASNETGYLIERSEDGGSTFKALPFGGVAPNITTFVDNDIESNITYIYRVKASNDNPNDYSNEATITTDNCVDTDLVFSGGTLVQTSISISGVPTSMPNCQTDVPVMIRVVGDFGASFEICDILGENLNTIGSTNISTGDCSLDGGVTNLTMSESTYNSWASDGTINLYLGSNINVNDICSVQNFTVCLSLENCGGGGGGGNCPNNYNGPNALAGTQTINETFDTDGAIQSSQTIGGGATVIYDSGTSIELLPGFSNLLGTALEIIIDGCN